MKTKNILLVEDDYLDIMSVKRALAKLKVPHNLHVVHNGNDALSFLNNTEGKKNLPDIILLDINMPKMNGLEFLSIIKSYYSLSAIQIYITTTSEEEYDKMATENAGVQGYITKPLDFADQKSNESVRKLYDALME